MQRLFEVLDPAFFFPSGHVLDDGALDKSKVVGQDILSRLDGHFAVVIAAELMRQFGHADAFFSHVLQRVVCSSATIRLDFEYSIPHPLFKNTAPSAPIQK